MSGPAFHLFAAVPGKKCLIAWRLVEACPQRSNGEVKRMTMALDYSAS